MGPPVKHITLKLKIFYLIHRFVIYSLLLSSSFVAAKSGGDFLEDLETDTSSFELEDALEKEPLTITKTYSTDVDLLLSDDIQVERYAADFEVGIGDNTIGFGFSRTEYDVDFFGPGLRTENLREGSSNYSLSLSHKWSDLLTSSVSVSGYEGFTSFRSVWFANFFEQTVGQNPAFREQGDPFGISASLTNTFSLPNEVDSISWTLSYARDSIVPGQSNTFTQNGLDVIVGDETLDTIATSITGNFYITNRITTQWFARAAFVSDRELRTQFRVKAAWNPIDRLTLRGEIGATFEPTNFQAFFGGGTITYQILPSLSLTAGYRVYTDTGEITSGNFNTAAPGADTNEVSASLLWTTGTHSLSASVAYVQTELDDLSAANVNFSQIFSDREFLAVRTAYTYRF